MWRLLFVMVAAELLVGACSEGLSAEEDYMKRTEANQEAVFAVSYDWVYDSPTLGFVSGTSTWYQDGRNARVDYGVDDGDSWVVITTAERSYTCSAVPNWETGLPGCVVDISGTLAIVDLSPLQSQWFAIHRPERYEIERAADRTIAGEKASCFFAEAKRVDERDSLLCFSEQALLLYADSSLNGRVWTATDVAAEVPDGIFEPPMEITGQSRDCDLVGC